MYIGSAEAVQESHYLWNKNEKRMIPRNVKCIPGLVKIFDEILVNAIDNARRSSITNQIDVSIDKSRITIQNNGPGIPVVIHKDEDVYVPELVLGNLLTGSNFDDSESRFTGGRHGYGAKLTNIMSNYFHVHTVDSERNLSFEMTWTDHMSASVDGPKISTVSQETKGFTKITFEPDVSLFGIKQIPKDCQDIMARRVYDAAGILQGKVQVSLNSKPIEVRTFERYASLFHQNTGMDVAAYSSPDIEVVVTLSPHKQLSHISFVNGIFTQRGGSHVDAIVEQVAQELLITANKRSKKDSAKVTVAHIKKNLQVFVNCMIPNPEFDSQVKDRLTSAIGEVQKYAQLPKSFLRGPLQSTNIVETVLEQLVQKDLTDLVRKGKSSKSAGRKLYGIPKLEDANLAGSFRGSECTLILTEGDSAKALAVAGISVVGRDRYGVYPLRGKLLNVREAATRQISNNMEITDLCKIVGLDFSKDYANDTKGLRYGKVMLMTDQDLDGSHIKGLVINFFHRFWPNLLKNDQFLFEFVTPILKAKKGEQQLSFFTLADFDQWINEDPSRRSWSVKYYKGLGTSTSKEGRDYFGNLPKHVLQFEWDKADDGKSNDIAIETAFSKSQVQARKEWLTKSLVLAGEGKLGGIDHNASHIRYTDFINKELVLFSHYDTFRSIPSISDGLKPSQRKVLFATFRKNLEGTKEMKVAQLGGFCSEHTAYHHGEVSLHTAIINMAQDYVGSNNMPLLYPSGQFGTRLQGGKDAASPRYIFTRLQRYTRAIIPKVDDDILVYNKDDGVSVEPVAYLPIIPTILVNGADGIGTGWSTKIPCHNPLDLIANIRLKIDGGNMTQIQPWYRGFKGRIYQSSIEKSKYSSGFVTNGTLEIKGKSISITELPIGRWTDEYKVLLNTFIEDGKIKDFKEFHTESQIQFELDTNPTQFAAITESAEKGLDVLKLSTNLTTNNMHLFDKNGTMKKYHSPLDILEEFYNIRLQGYEDRKAHQSRQLESLSLVQDNQLRFLEEVSSGKFTVHGSSKASIVTKLIEANYSPDPRTKNESEKLDSKSFNYLLNTPLWDFTTDAVDTLRSKQSTTVTSLRKLTSQSPGDMWKEDLDHLEVIIKEDPLFL